MDEAGTRARMQQVLNLISSDIASIRTGRATSALVETLEMSVYGGTQKLKLQELASITIPDPGLIVIDPWDKSIIGEIRQSLQAINLGMNPSIDGEVIRIAMPPLTTEDREKYVKLLSTKLENGKIMIRQIRGEGMHEIKKKFESKEITEDEKFSQEKSLQALTDEFTGLIDSTGEKKKQELLQI